MDMPASCSTSAAHQDEEHTEDSESDSSDEDEDGDHNRRKKTRIRINMQSIPCIQLQEQDQDLCDLGVTAYDQNDYEEGVMRQIDHALELPANPATPKSGSGPTAASVLSDFTQPSAVPSSASTSSSGTPESAGIAVVDVEEEDEDEYRPGSESESETDLMDQGEDEDDEFLPSDEERRSLTTKRKTSSSRRSSKVSPLPKRMRGKSRVPYREHGSDSDPDSGSKSKSTKSSSSFKDYSVSKVKDDGDEKYFHKRMKKLQSDLSSYTQMVDIDEKFRVPSNLWSSLFPHQRSCIKWLWELHQTCVGGIIGDEMGLGKTVQIIAFLSGLHNSDNSDNFRESFTSLGPTVIVCPATVMHQWLTEFYKWYPVFRVAILHSTGSYSGGKSALIRRIHKSNGILIMTYSCVKDYQEDLSAFDWHYVILDEGHKIRNPDAQITLACKRFRTPHRIILSGSPIQNNLKELWSLFDFIMPGKLGTLPVFMEQFSIPITQGGYANASDVQVKIAFKCATVLRDTIRPFLLRRMKEDVKDAINLPKKNEQVLFCRLTEEQRTLYKEYLQSPDIKDILRGSNQMFVGLINLRKICNHPDLFQGYKQDNVRTPAVRKPITLNVENDPHVSEYFTRSGKMLVVQALLKLWSKQGHKVLLFSQGTQMMNILEQFLKLADYTYIKLDGGTSIGQRQPLIHRFNQDPGIFIFLLTTRVGGIGVNLTGASRVLIYDPDWNPSTDMQARERAWRIGQDQQVTIYRLLTAGTIEEKIYHRQVFKQYLTNRVLRDPKQRRFFKTNDLYELFTLGSQESDSTESSAIFAGTGSDVSRPDPNAHANGKKSKKHRKDKKKKNTDHEVTLSEERRQELRERAKKLSLLLASKFNSPVSAEEVPPEQGMEQPVQHESIASELAAKRSVPGAKSPDRKEKKAKKKKKSKHKNKYKNSVVIDGEEISNLVKRDTYQDLESQKSSEKVSAKQDDYVLSQLFKSSKGVIHSALQHDVIEGAGQGVVADYTLVEAEAEKVANDAIAALQRSRRQCFSAESGIPSWTGMSGRINNNSNSKKNKPTFGSAASSSLLTAIKSRSRLDDNIEDYDDHGQRQGSSCGGSDDASVDQMHEEMLQDLRAFISFQGTRPGEVTTNEVLQKFGSRIPSHQTPVFKAFLWKVADFHRRPNDNVGVWRLKPQFSS